MTSCVCVSVCLSVCLEQVRDHRGLLKPLNGGSRVERPISTHLFAILYIYNSPVSIFFWHRRSWVKIPKSHSEYRRKYITGGRSKNRRFYINISLYLRNGAIWRLGCASCTTLSDVRPASHHSTSYRPTVYLCRHSTRIEKRSGL